MLALYQTCVFGRIVLCSASSAYGQYPPADFTKNPFLLGVPVDRAARGAKREALTRRKSAAALDGHWAPRSGEEIPTHQRLSRTPVAEGAPESVAHPAEGGADSRSLNLFAGRFTVPNTPRVAAIN